MSGWNAYYEAVGTGPSLQLVEVVRKYARNHGSALDLGAGNLRNANYLREVGFAPVQAVDREKPPELVEGVEFSQMDLRAFTISLCTFDLVLSYNTLFYVPKEDIKAVVFKAYQGLKPHGILFFNVLGDQDEWVRNQVHGVSGFNKEEALALVANWELEEYERRTGLKRGVVGPHKLWDIWRFVIRK